jgi:two-component system, response regulator FlrC
MRLSTGAEISNILSPDGARFGQARHTGVPTHAATAAEQVTRNLVGRTVAEVERDLILETLKHCLGNRTHAANILGISIRTLRNKLNEYAADGSQIPPPHGGRELAVSGVQRVLEISLGERALPTASPARASR